MTLLIQIGYLHFIKLFTFSGMFSAGFTAGKLCATMFFSAHGLLSSFRLVSSCLEGTSTSDAICLGDQEDSGGH